jgi:hypothetical protein
MKGPGSKDWLERQASGHIPKKCQKYLGRKARQNQSATDKKSKGLNHEEMGIKGGECNLKSSKTGIEIYLLM